MIGWKIAFDNMDSKSDKYKKEVIGEVVGFPCHEQGEVYSVPVYYNKRIKIVFFEKEEGLKVIERLPLKDASDQ